ncbi:MAG: hypothetical protein AAFR05_21000, partial [Bacteroidota bacterium]
FFLKLLFFWYDVCLLLERKRMGKNKTKSTPTRQRTTLAHQGAKKSAIQIIIGMTQQHNHENT